MQSQQTADELACTLMEEELRLRRQFLRRTLKPCIESVETEALGLTIAFSKETTRSTIEEFVAFERQCCAFLTFNIVPDHHGTKLKISEPKGSEAVLHMFADGASA